MTQLKEESVKAVVVMMHKQLVLLLEVEQLEVEVVVIVRWDRLVLLALPVEMEDLVLQADLEILVHLVEMAFYYQDHLQNLLAKNARPDLQVHQDLLDLKDCQDLKEKPALPDEMEHQDCQVHLAHKVRKGLQDCQEIKVHLASLER